MRVVLDLVIGINAVAGIIGFTARHFIRKRRAEALEHADYQRLLREQNRELDEDRKRLGLG